MNTLGDSYHVVARGRMDTGLTSYADVGACNLLLDQHTLLSTPAKLDITSASTSDAAAGTGARTIQIAGLGATKKFQTEIVTLNGTTIVQSALTWYRVFGFKVLTVGTGKSNAGIIYIVKTGMGGTYTTPGVPGTFTAASALSKALVGSNQGTTCFYTTPNYAKGRWRVSKLGFSSKGFTGTVAIMIEDHSTGTPAYREYYLDFPAGFSGVDDLTEYGIEVGPDTDIRAIALGASGGLVAAASLYIDELKPIW